MEYVGHIWILDGARRVYYSEARHSPGRQVVSWPIIANPVELYQV